MLSVIACKTLFDVSYKQSEDFYMHFCSELMLQNRILFVDFDTDAYAAFLSDVGVLRKVTLEQAVKELKECLLRDFFIQWITL